MKNFLRQAFYLFFCKIIKFPVFSIAWIRKKVKGFPKIHGKKFKIGGKFPAYFGTRDPFPAGDRRTSSSFPFF